MKKSYIPPSISFLSLSANGVSAACTYISNHAVNVCPLEIPEWDGETVFSDYNICDWTPNDNVCYDVPTAATNVFES